MLFAILIVKITALLLAALAISLLMRSTSAGARHQVWLVALVALLLLPALAIVSPLRLKVLPATFSPPTSAAQLSGGTTTQSPPANAAIPATPGTSTPASNPTTTPGTVGGFSLATIAAAVWLVVVLMLAGWLLHGWYLVRRIVSRAEPLESPEWHAPLYEVADRLGLAEAPRLLRSSDVHMPFACGLLRGTIVLPAESDTWTTEQRTAVLIHELGHVRRRDLLGHTLGRVACAIYWFHPLVWTAARRLRDESERACDDLALTFGARPSEYAEHLLAIVTSVRDHATPSIALAMAHRKEFEGRMLAILDPQLRRAAPSRLQSASVISLLAVGSLVLGAAAPVPRDPAPSVQTLTAPNPKPTPEPMADPAPSTLPQQRAAHVNTKTDLVVKTHTAAEIRQLVQNELQGVDQGSTVADDDRAALLVKLLRTDSSASVRRIAAWGLRKFPKDAAANEALARAMSSDADERVREMSVWALVEGGAALSAATLETALRDKSSEVREMAAWGFGDRGINEGAATLGKLVASDESAQVRATAAWALGQLDLRTAPKGLIDALADADADVRYKASWALSEIGDKAAVPALRKAMDKESHEGALRAQLRAVIASGISPEELAPLLSSKHPAARAAAARALSGDLTSSPWPWPWPRPIPIP